MAVREPESSLLQQVCLTTLSWLKFFQFESTQNHHHHDVLFNIIFPSWPQLLYWSTYKTFIYTILSKPKWATYTTHLNYLRDLIIHMVLFDAKGTWSFELYFLQLLKCHLSLCYVSFWEPYSQTLWVLFSTIYGNVILPLLW